MKCGFCSTAWKTRKAKGTRSAFSWTATFFCLAAIIVVAFWLGRELGVLRSSQVKPNPVESTNVSADYVENAENAAELEYVDGESTTAEENVENAADAENVDVSEDLGLLEDAEGGEGSGAE